MLQSSYEVNVFAPFKISRQFVPAMIKKKWGRIINICSSSSYFGGGTPRHCLYTGTKHALLGFSKALDDELREYNIHLFHQLINILPINNSGVSKANIFYFYFYFYFSSSSNL